MPSMHAASVVHLHTIPQQSLPHLKQPGQCSLMECSLQRVSQGYSTLTPWQRQPNSRPGDPGLQK